MSEIDGILDSLKSLRTRSDSSLTEVILKWTSDDKQKFKKHLSELECALGKCKKAKKVKSSESDQDIFLQQLENKLRRISRSGVIFQEDIVVNLINQLGQELNGRQPKELVQSFVNIGELLASLCTLKTLGEFDQARIISYLVNILEESVEKVANDLGITKRKTQEYLKFYDFCMQFPALIFSGYSMSVLIKYSKPISQRAGDVSEFGEALKVATETFEYYFDGDMKEKVVSAWTLDVREQRNFVDNIDTATNYSAATAQLREPAEPRADPTDESEDALLTMVD